MSATITGVVTNGVVVPSSPLPEGTRVEIHTSEPMRAAGTCHTPAELRKMPRSERQPILASAAAIAEDEYRDNKELTGFDAFSEEADDDAN